MVHLEHLQAPVRIAVGEGIQARAQHHVLAHAARIGARELVLGIAAAHDEEGAHGARALRPVAVQVLAQPAHALGAEDA
jgi:hypothetical protein